MKIQVKGLEEYQEKIGKLKKPLEFFDDVVAKTAVDGLNRLTKKTPYDPAKRPSPHTRNMWKLPRQISLSVYGVDNTKVSQDGRHAIAGIINYGRGPVVPKRAKSLFIPLTKRAMKKKLGAPIPKNWIRGSKKTKEQGLKADYIFVKKAGPYKGTRFISDTMDLMDQVLIRRMIKKLREVF